MTQGKDQNKEVTLLKSQLLQKDFARDVLDQVEKDLVRSGVFEVGCMQDSNLELNAMIQQLGVLIQNMIQNNIESFPTYLYLVDIPESQIEHEFLDISKVNRTAEIILIREAQKVYLRRRFSS